MNTSLTGSKNSHLAYVVSGSLASFLVKVDKFIYLEICGL